MHFTLHCTTLAWPSQIVGVVPEIGRLGAIETLLLNNNHISGKITPSLGQLSVAKLIDLSANDGLSLKQETKVEIKAMLGKTVEVRI